MLCLLSAQTPPVAGTGDLETKSFLSTSKSPAPGGEPWGALSLSGRVIPRLPRASLGGRRGGGGCFTQTTLAVNVFPSVDPVCFLAKTS